MMDRSRDDLFSAARLPGDKHRRIGLGDALGGCHQALERGAVHNRGHTKQDLRVGGSGQEARS